MLNGYCKKIYDQVESLIDFDFFRDNMGEDANEERAQQLYEKCVKTEQQFGDVFTGKDLIFYRK